MFLKHIDFLYICPEMESGSGLPGPTMQLRQQQEEIRLVFSKFSNTDITKRGTGMFAQILQQIYPFITPLTLLMHHLRVMPQKYIAKQYSLNPFPEQLALRSSL